MLWDLPPTLSVLGPSGLSYRESRKGHRDEAQGAKTEIGGQTGAHIDDFSMEYFREELAPAVYLMRRRDGSRC